MMTDAAASLLTFPPPRIAPGRLAALLRDHWGLAGALSPLTSERDLNFRLDAPQGRLVVKLTNPAEPEAMTDFQSRAFLHVAARDPDLPVQRLIPPAGHDTCLALPEGRLRVFTWLDGTPLHQTAPTDRQRRAIGAAAARLALALGDYRHPAAGHLLLWDLRQMPALAPLVPRIADPALRDEAAAFIAHFSETVSPRLDRMPRQVVHADFNPHNLLAAPGDPGRIAGILDFGDMVETPRICDLAVAASYQIAPGAPAESVAALVAGYAGEAPLAAEEVALLPDLIMARLVTTLTITAWRAALYPGNAAYILRNAPSARAGLAAFGALGREALTGTLTEAAGTK